MPAAADDVDEHSTSTVMLHGALSENGADDPAADVAGELMDNLGAQLKAARTRAGFTLRELARQAEVSPSFVSQIENGKSQPSVATLYTFSRLLGISVDELFEHSVPTAAPAGNEGHPINAWHPSEYSNRVSVVHPDHRSRLDMAEGVVWERLAATPEHGVSFMKIVYAPGAASTEGGGMVSHDGYEYGYVLQGVVEVSVGAEVFTLRAGESLGFDSSIPHAIRNVGDSEFHGVWFVHTSRH